MGAFLLYTPPMLFAPANKDEGYALYERQAFGNQLVAWPSVDAYLESNYSGLVVIRNKIPGDKRCVYGITRDEVIVKMQEWDPTGRERHIFKMNELAEDHLLVLQGEVTQETGHLEVRYSTIPKPMRTALAEGQQIARGLKAYALLRTQLDDLDFDHLMELLNSYTGIRRFEGLPHDMPSTLDDPHTRVTIEFSVWSKKVGTWNRRMVVWEIRNY